MGMLMHRHLVENTSKTAQKGPESPSVTVEGNPVVPDDKPVKAPSKPVKRAARGRAK